MHTHKQWTVTLWPHFVQQNAPGETTLWSEDSCCFKAVSSSVHEQWVIKLAHAQSSTGVSFCASACVGAGAETKKPVQELHHVAIPVQFQYTKSTCKSQNCTSFFDGNNIPELDDIIHSHLVQSMESMQAQMQMYVRRHSFGVWYLTRPELHFWWKN